MKNSGIILQAIDARATVTKEDPQANSRVRFEKSFNQTDAEKVLKKSRNWKLKPDQGYVFKEGSLVLAAKPKDERPKFEPRVKKEEK